MHAKLGRIANQCRSRAIPAWRAGKIHTNDVSVHSKTVQKSDVPEISISLSDFMIFLQLLYHEDLEKRRKVWRGGARETREPRVTIE